MDVDRKKDGEEGHWRCQLVVAVGALFGGERLRLCPEPRVVRKIPQDRRYAG